MPNVMDIEGVGEAYAKKLEGAGIKTTDALLEAGKTPQGRKALEEQTGISHTLVLKWVNHVDLYRIKGVGSEYSELLEAAGVDTVPELAQRKPEHLLDAVKTTNEAKKLVRRLPTLSQVADWVGQAKKLPRIVQY